MQMSIPLKLNRVALLTVIVMLGSITLGESLFSPKTSMMALLMSCKTEEERERLRQQRDAMPPRKVFYGRIVDTEGKPIPDAVVVVSWNTLSLRKGFSDETYSDTLKTDGNGCFKKQCPNVARFFADVSKDGYEAVYQLGSDDFIKHPLHSEENPVTFVLRKRGPLTFLILSPNTGKRLDNVFESDETNSVSSPLDLLAWDSSRKWKDSATTNADLQIDAVFDATGQCWNITYSVTNGPGGIVLSDEMLYEAPADGYVPSVSVTCTTNSGIRKYLYVKSRTPAVYSRTEFSHRMNFRDVPLALGVACKAWVNPYGERGLEFDERIDSAFGLAESLRKEALEAFASGRYPEKKKDMGKLAEETRERVLREQEERNRRNREFQEQQRKLKEAKKK